MEKENKEGLQTMSYLIQMRGFLQYVAERNYDARYIYHLEDKIYNWRQRVGQLETKCWATGDNVFGNWRQIIITIIITIVVLTRIIPSAN